MQNNSRNLENDIIDLTDSGDNDTVVNPLRQRTTSQPQRKRRQDDVEIVSVTHSGRSGRPPRIRRRNIERNQNNDEGLDVLEEKTLTPLERLRRIQEQHSRGEVVHTNQPTNRRSYPMPSFGAFHAARGGPRLMSPHGFYPYMIHPGHPINPMFSFMGLYGRNIGDNSNLEQNVIDRTIEASMNETDYSKRLDIKTLMLPPAPAEPKEGFTRSLNGDTELVCIKCNYPLGKAREDLTATLKFRSQSVFARGCGHVYCGLCTYNMKDRSNKNKACPVEECKRLSPKKRGLFREVYL